jgi:hypothetical protein
MLPLEALDNHPHCAGRNSVLARQTSKSPASARRRTGFREYAGDLSLRQLVPPVALARRARPPMRHRVGAVLFAARGALWFCLPAVPVAARSALWLCLRPVRLPFCHCAVDALVSAVLQRRSPAQVVRMIVGRIAVGEMAHLQALGSRPHVHLKDGLGNAYPILLAVSHQPHSEIALGGTRLHCARRLAAAPAATPAPELAEARALVPRKARHRFPNGIIDHAVSYGGSQLRAVAKVGASS